MKKLNVCFLLLLFCLPIQYSFGQNDNIMNYADTLKSGEKLPEYPGGINALYQHIQKDLRYPKIARLNNVSGIVLIGFVVEKDGSVSNVVVESTNFKVKTETIMVEEIDYNAGEKALCEEALRVIRNMSHWNPGISEGKPVRCVLQIPIVFALK